MNNHNHFKSDPVIDQSPFQYGIKKTSPFTTQIPSNSCQSLSQIPNVLHHYQQNSPSSEAKKQFSPQKFSYQQSKHDIQPIFQIPHKNYQEDLQNNRMGATFESRIFHPFSSCSSLSTEQGMNSSSPIKFKTFQAQELKKQEQQVMPDPSGQTKQQQQISNQKELHPKSEGLQSSQEEQVKKKINSVALKGQQSYFSQQNEQFPSLMNSRDRSEKVGQNNLLFSSNITTSQFIKTKQLQINPTPDPDMSLKNTINNERVNSLRTQQFQLMSSYESRDTGPVNNLNEINSIQECDQSVSRVQNQSIISQTRNNSQDPCKSQIKSNFEVTLERENNQEKKSNTCNNISSSNKIATPNDNLEQQRQQQQFSFFPPKSASSANQPLPLQQHSLGKGHDYGKNISDEEDQLADVIDSSDQEGGINNFQQTNISNTNNKKGNKLQQQNDTNDSNIYPQHDLSPSQDNPVPGHFFSPSQQGTNHQNRKSTDFRKNIDFSTNRNDEEEAKYPEQQQYQQDSFSQQQQQPQNNAFSHREQRSNHQQQQPSEAVNIDFSMPGDNRYTYNKKTDDHIRELYGNKVAQSRSNKTGQQLTNPAMSRGSQRSAQKSGNPLEFMSAETQQSNKIPPKRYSRSPEIHSSSKFGQKYPNSNSKSMINSPEKKRKNFRTQPNESSSQFTEQGQDPVYNRLYQHSKHLEQRKHIKKLTQNIYDETSQMKEVKIKPTVNDNSQKFAKRKQMYRLGAEPIQNALYRDFIYRQKRKQDQLNQVHAQLSADINRQKTNSNSYKLALKKLQKDLQEVFRECDLDPTGQLSYSNVSTIISKIGVFKIHGNQVAIKRFEQKAKALATNAGTDGIFPFNQQGISNSMNNILMLANSCNKKAAGNALVQTQQRREREKELHLQLWRYLNPMNLNKIESLVLMEFFKVILCQFTQNVKELASTVNELMNIAHNENKTNQENFHIQNEEREDEEDPFSNNDEQDLSAIPMYHPMHENSSENQHPYRGPQDFEESPPPIPAHIHHRQHLDQHIASSSYPPDPPTQSESNDDVSSQNHARNPSGSHFSRVSNNSNPNNAQQQISSTSMAAQQIMGEHSSPIASPQQVDHLPSLQQQQLHQQQSHRVAQLSGIPEETILSNQGGSGIGSRLDDQRDLLSGGDEEELVESPNTRFRVGSGGGGQLSTNGMSNAQNQMPQDAQEHSQWSIEDILKQIKSLNQGTLILKRPDKRLSQKGAANSEIFLRESKQQWMKQIQGLEQSRQINDLPTELRKEADQYTFKPKINPKSKHIKSKLKQMLLEKKETAPTPQKEEQVPEKAKYQKSIEKAEAKRPTTYRHNKLLEARQEYEKRLKEKQNMKKKEELQNCTFKPNINSASKKLESRFSKMNRSLSPPQARRQSQQSTLERINLEEMKSGPSKQSTRRDQGLRQSLPQVGEYLNCTFKPTIMGSKFNKNILKKKNIVAKGTQDAAKRMRQAFQEKEKIKNYLESMKLGENYEKNKKLKSKPPTLKTTERAAKETQTPIIFLDVNVGPGKTGRLVLKKNQPLSEAANQFAKIYHLNDYMKLNLIQMLKEQYNEYLMEKEQQEQQIHLDGNNIMPTDFNNDETPALPLQPDEIIVQSDMKNEQVSSIEVLGFGPKKKQGGFNSYPSEKSESQADLPLFQELKSNSAKEEGVKEVQEDGKYQQKKNVEEEDDIQSVQNKKYENLNTGDTLMDTQETRNSQQIRDAFEY